MRRRLLDLLACPICRGRLEPRVFEEGPEGTVEEGVLLCETCRTWYPIAGGIPRLLPPGLYNPAEFLARHVTQFTPLGSLARSPRALAASPLDDVRQRTMTSFGFEWTHFDRFGWDDLTRDREREARTFPRKSLFDPAEFSGKLVLDAGCGNGRYAFQAARGGAEVVGVDIGRGVEVAHRNTAPLAPVHILQADLFRLPFLPGTFDMIFAIGVLMHTGDARGAFRALSRYLKPGGSISVHLYHRGNVLYEWLDGRLRARTTRLPLQDVLRWATRAARVARVLSAVGLLGLVNAVLRLETDPHCVFDWYAAPVATHHTYDEVFGWLRDEGLVLEADRRKRYTWFRKTLWPPWSLTVRARKPMAQSLAA